MSLIFNVQKTSVSLVKYVYSPKVVGLNQVSRTNGFF